MNQWGTITLLVLLLTACQPSHTVFQGYVEGEYLSIAATRSGVLQTLYVRRGQPVQAGQKLFALDATELKANLRARQAEVRRAEAHLRNLLKGKRVEEIVVIRKQRDQANIRLMQTKKSYQRAKKLIRSASISPSEYDKREADYHSAHARRDELEAQLKVALLGPREDEITMAKAERDRAKQNCVRARQQFIDSAPTAQQGSVVTNTYFHPGEYVAAGQAVLRLLPPENVKIRFFVPQAQLTQLQLGDRVLIHCDGCTQSIQATIRFIASKAEYTPPVIYSTDSRQKLVVMVEAQPTPYSASLRPGLPVDIEMMDR